MYSRIETIPFISHEDMKYVRPYVTDFVKCRTASTREVSASLYVAGDAVHVHSEVRARVEQTDSAGFGFIHGNPFLQRKKFGQTRHILHVTIGRRSPRFLL